MAIDREQWRNSRVRAVVLVCFSSSSGAYSYAKQINRTKQLALKKKKLEEMLHHYQVRLLFSLW